MKSFLNIIKKPRKIAVYLLKNYSLVLFLYNSYYRLKNKKRFYSELEKRKKISIFNYKKLAQPLPYFPIETTKDSNFYGIYNSIKKFSGINKITHSIEHGLYLGNYVPFATYLKTTKSIITFSENRRKHLINAGIKKPIVAIGPYIHYATIPVSEKKFKQLKQSLGKTFLLFPSHSIKDFNVNMDVNELINNVKKIVSSYDSILVCLFYQDIIDGIYPKYFEEAGFKIVTAGNRFDINFLSRLKLIIELADFTASNTIGTHTGYCVYLNKPHFVIEQEIKRSKGNNTPIIEYRDEEQIKTMEEEKAEIIKEFTKYSEQITEGQKNVVEKFWGTSLIKSPTQLFDILN